MSPPDDPPVPTLDSSARPRTCRVASCHVSNVTARDLDPLGPYPARSSRAVTHPTRPLPHAGVPDAAANPRFETSSSRGMRGEPPSPSRVPDERLSRSQLLSSKVLPHARFDSVSSTGSSNRAAG
jgi:hypothetical protein